MFEDIGPMIRKLRTQRGIGLNTFADHLQVSPGYLSNLETEKTDTISLPLLSRLQKELQLFPHLHVDNITEGNDLHLRLIRMYHQLHGLHKENPDAAEYLISHVEKGIQLFHSQ